MRSMSLKRSSRLQLLTALPSLARSLAATAHGTALVVYLHYFAKIIHVLSLGPPKYEGVFRSQWIEEGGKK
uniref:Uncharacterized protein n=1 Tax=Fagus sylvatica TaxID=28930 RepID=A0A2N9GAA5_FAGSY